MNDVFLSYSFENEDVALKIKDKLNDSGLSVWMPKDSTLGEGNFEDIIPNAVENSRTFVIVLSSDSQDSTNVSKELALASELKKPIFPFCIEKLELNDEFNRFLLDAQFVDINPDKLDSDDIKSIISRIKNLELAEKNSTVEEERELTIFNFLSFPPDEIVEQLKKMPLRAYNNFRKKPGPTIKAFALTMAILAVLAGIFNYFENHITIDLSKCMSIDVYGINDYGIIEGNVDFSKLSEKTRKKLNEKEIYDYDFTVYLSESDYLTNGDVVTIDVSYNKDLTSNKVKFKNSSINYQITDLPEGTAIDAFEYVFMKYEGLNGEGVAHLVVDKNDFGFEYILSKSYNLSVGDTITVSLNYDGKQLSASGYGVITNKKTFTVDALDEMVSSESQVSRALIDKLSSELSDKIIAQAKSTFVSYGENQYRGASVIDDSIYLIKLKDDRYDSNVNGIVFLQPVTIKVATFFGMGDMAESKLYARSVVFNISVTSEGENKYDIENSEIRYFDDYDTWLASVEGWYGDKYDIFPLVFED